MGIFKCCCQGCDLEIGDLPDITISGMTASTDWIASGECCYYRNYTYNTTQPRSIVSTDLQRLTFNRLTTQMMVANFIGGACTDLFDCYEQVVDFTAIYIERLGMHYRRNSVDVFIQKANLNCGSGAVPKYIVSTRHNVAYLADFMDVILNEEIATFESKNCCTGAESYDYSNIDDEPDWSNYFIWPQAFDSLTSNGYYWNHKVYDELPTASTELIDGCIDPCTDFLECVSECEDLCITSEPSEEIPVVGGEPICPTPTTFIARDCTFTTGGCTYTLYYYSNAAISPCNGFAFCFANPDCILDDVDTSSCASSVTNVKNDVTSFDLASTCVFNYGAELCLNGAISLTFP